MSFVPTVTFMRILICGLLWLVGSFVGVVRPMADARAEDASTRNADWLEAFRTSREAMEWTDLAVRHDWRLQRHAGDGRFRILDPRDRVIGAGEEATCHRMLAALEANGTIPRHDTPTVILLHGLGEDRRSMQPLADHLRTVTDSTVVSFGYASLEADLDAHGLALAQVVAGLPRTTPVSFVGHSLGNLVVRRWMALAEAGDLERVDRVVMLGPPNQGSYLARLASGIWGVADRMDGSARDLVIDWQRVAPRLAVPACDFGIVAGGRGDGAGYSLLLPGDDDAIVCVDETRLEGAHDFLVVPVHHAAMMKHPGVQRATVSFLETGRFEASADPATENAAP